MTQILSWRINLGSIKLLNIQANLIYDGTRIKWQQDLRLLKNFVENVVGLSDKWKSPGGGAKRFIDSNLDLAITWYSEKQNSLIFYGKDGELLRKFLVGILDPSTVYSDTDNHTTKTSLEAGYMLEEVSEVINETNTHVNTCEVYGDSCHCKIDSKDLKDIKSEVETLQRQMKSVNIAVLTIDVGDLDC